MKTYKADDKVGQLKLSIAINLIPTLPPVPCKDYRLIVLDPPWQYGLRETDPSHRGRCPYPAMTDQQIMDMPISAIGADDSYILLWTTNNHQFLAFQCLLAWGYEHKSTFTWVKVTIAGKPHMGMGHYGRNCTEHLLVGKKGKVPSMKTLGMTNVLNVIYARRQEHSRKPEEFWVLANTLGQRLENCESLGKLSQPSRIELFARQQRPNWDAWGAETNLSNALV